MVRIILTVPEAATWLVANPVCLCPGEKSIFAVGVINHWPRVDHAGEGFPPVESPDRTGVTATSRLLLDH